MKTFKRNNDLSTADQVFPVIKKACENYLVLASAPNLRMSHLSLYSAFIVSYVLTGCQNPFTVTRRTIMKLSNISSKTTYHRCLGALQTIAVIEYYPSFHPGGKSLITLI